MSNADIVVVSIVFPITHCFDFVSLTKIIYQIAYLQRFNCVDFNAWQKPLTLWQELNIVRRCWHHYCSDLFFNILRLIINS
nr:MAG TPA: hypothetical protein [Caudoviricetes sp.]